MPENLKAGERRCRGCDVTIPAQPSGPGRPRLFHSRECRRRYYDHQEQAETKRQREEEKERRLREYEERVWGKREAARRARWRAGKQ